MKLLLAHADIVLSGMLLVLLVIDRVNTAMQFIDNHITKGLLFGLCAVCFVSGLVLMAQSARRGKR
ncbi:MAG: hypothetical protein IJC54_04945 [Clostridia bacterium]|nr:hypothetical protein [Clostridia bacterium]MBQ4085898.1 hypothetical protein [Clostridia bacterium]